VSFAVVTADERIADAFALRHAYAERCALSAPPPLRLHLVYQLLLI
jgi:hypothetical protein